MLSALSADGHTVTVPIRSDTVVQPGTERVIVGEGMPISKQPGKHRYPRADKSRMPSWFMLELHTNVSSQG
jgi:hypothetical protein